jgi:membrane protein DedA with SNARE-associated domain
MLLDFIADIVQSLAIYAKDWGFPGVFVLMAIESSFLPLPSEAVLIPAGFMAFRGELTFGSAIPDMAVVVLCGMVGSVVGAYFNYFLSLWLGRPILHRFGKYFFLSEKHLNRAEEIFREYGDITTFVCRLLPAIRHLISIPAGLSKMPLGRFTFFTALGAGIWSAILTGVGYYLGSLSGDMTYRQIAHRGKDLVMHNFIWILLGLAICIAIYIYIHKKVMDGPATSQAAVEGEEKAVD